MWIVGVCDEFMIVIKETLGWSKLFALDKSWPGENIFHSEY